MAITIPARRDDLIADVLAAAYLQQSPPSAVAYRHGQQHSVTELGALGFQPRESDDLIRLGNCPFHAPAARHGSLICEIALSFVAGMSSGAPGYEAVPSPRPGGCCVALRRTKS